MTCLKDMGKKKGAKDLKKALKEAADDVKALLERAGKLPEVAKAKL